LTDRVHLALVGATASGKSALALEAAEILGDVEIVSADSMQVYRGFDIGTAKPSLAERARVPHHLLDIVDPSEEWSVVRFRDAARAAIAEIESRGRRALLVGGTGLYVRAVIDDLEFPPTDPVRRARLAEEVTTPRGLTAAYQDLVRADPVTAARTDPNNARRIVRALEVVELTGRPFSSFGEGLGRYGAPLVPVCMVGVWLPRDTLTKRIRVRVRAMRDGGFLNEVRELEAPDTLSMTARQAIGYRELLAHLGDGALSEDAAFGVTAQRTRAFARRQRMWFRRDPRIRWLGTRENPSALRAPLLANWRK
jgi:tRNA dimethylallyltransferase